MLVDNSIKNRWKEEIHHRSIVHRLGSIYEAYRKKQLKEYHQCLFYKVISRKTEVQYGLALNDHWCSYRIFI